MHKTPEEMAEHANNLNIARLRQLSWDADEKAQQAGKDEKWGNCEYYIGMRDGLKRAINVLEGRG